MVVGLLVVLLAGCVNNSGDSAALSAGNGLRIVEFSASPSEVGPGEPVTVVFQLENSGDKIARNIVVEPIGPSEVVGDNTVESVGDLDPTDKRYGGTGEPYFGTFTVTSPSNIPYNQRITVPLYLRVYYDYSSSAVTEPVTVYSKEEWKRRVGKGESFSVQTVQITNNDGPIQFYVENTVNPVVDRTDENPRVPIIVSVRNLGEGVPFMNGEEGLLAGNIKVISNAISSIECRAGEDTFYPQGGDTVNLNFKLTRRGEKKFVCYLYFDRTRIQDINTFQLQFDFDYRYYITAQTIFTAWGNS